MAVMRLLLFADVHLDAPFTWAPATVAGARRRAVREALTSIVELADELRVDALCCAGDLYEHGRSGADTGAFLRSAFGELACPVLLAPGNHDWLGPASLYEAVKWSSQVTVFREDRLAPFALTDGFTVWGAAHRAPANTDGFLDRFQVDREGVSVALFHGAERGGLALQGADKQPHAPFVAEQVPAGGLSHAMVGHFHRPAHGRWHTYPGNPEPLTFGEDGARGAVLLEIGDDGAVRRETFDVGGPPWHDVSVEVERAEYSGAIREQVREALSAVEGIVRLTVSGEVAPGVDLAGLDLSGVAGHLDALVVRPLQIVAGYDLAALAREATVRGHFVRDVQGAGLEPAMERRVLRAGLLALDGRGDELAAV
jgi:exonuclease SbcD